MANTSSLPTLDASDIPLERRRSLRGPKSKLYTARNGEYLMRMDVQLPFTMMLVEMRRVMILKLEKVMLWRPFLLSWVLLCQEYSASASIIYCILSLQLPSSFYLNSNRNWIACHDVKGWGKNEIRTCQLSWNPHLWNHGFPYFTSRSYFYSISRSVHTWCSFFILLFVQFVRSVYYLCNTPWYVNRQQFNVEELVYVSKT